MVIHTTKEFGKSHIDETKVTAIQDIITERLQQLLPECPMPSQIKFHKWRYSQVKKNILFRKFYLTYKFHNIKTLLLVIIVLPIIHHTHIFFI